MGAIELHKEYLPGPTQALDEITVLQRHWANEITATPLPAPPTLVAGCDVHLRGDLGRATIVVLRLPDLGVVETVHGEAPITFPYIPGFLSWREVPPLAVALQNLTVRPDVLLADGHGIAHPRGLGIASHLGLLSGLPTVGCAKSILRGRHAELPETRGAQVPLLYQGGVVGMVVRTKHRVKPLYVSVGNRITLPEAVDLVLQCDRNYRLPEPSRLAHLAAQRWARGEDDSST